MRKLSLLAIMTLFCLGGSLVQAQAYEGIGDKKLQIGLSPYGNGTGITGTFDYGIHEYFSLGAGGEFYFDSDKDNDADFYIFGRANAHLGNLLNMPANMDLYPGIDVGVLGDDVGFGGHLGYRYFWSNNLGAYIEVGSRGSIGLSFNF